MDTPVTRTKQQIIGFYARGLLQFMELSEKQYDLFCMALTLACNEIEDGAATECAKHATLVAELNTELLRLHTDLNNLRNGYAAQSKEMDRLLALEAKRVQAVQMNGTAPSYEPEEPPGGAAAAAQPRRGGRKPGAKNKQRKTPKVAIASTAAQIEGGTPAQMATLDRSLISDDLYAVALNGTLHREESLVTTQHGIPVRVTRQYIEIR